MSNRRIYKNLQILYRIDISVNPKLRQYQEEIIIHITDTITWRKITIRCAEIFENVISVEKF